MNYYLFATYVFILVCIIVIICKYLFADVKRQRRMLDEKEKQLLDTYRTLEDAMDDYYAAVSDAQSELEEKRLALESQILLPAAAPVEAPEPKPAKPKKASVKKPVKPVEAPVEEPRDDSQLVFEQILSDAAANVSTKSQLHENILELTRQGKSRAEVAKLLQITQNEVELVTGMNRETLTVETDSFDEKERALF